MRKIDLQSVVYKEGGHYISQCLDVDVSSFGKTKKEAIAMLADALHLYFEDMPLPDKTKRVENASIASIELQHA
jgi:predicted RNase H-like HicB family nuclease